MGKQWKAATGIDDMKPTPQQLVGNLVTWFIAALALGLISTAIGADDVGDGIVLGLVVSFGFIGTNRITQQLYERDKAALMKVNAPYVLLGFTIMGIILSVMD